MIPQRGGLEKVYHDEIISYLRDHPERFVEAAGHPATDEKTAPRSGSWRPGRGIPAKARQPSPILVAPGVRLQWHSVVPGQYHTLLRITPANQETYAQDPRFQNTDDQGRRYATIGAGPVWDALVSETNRENDVQPHEPGVPISPPPGMSEDAFINLMLKADREYPDDLDYGFLPHPAIPTRGIGPSYNSNSYIAGLLRAVGVVSPELPISTPGYDMPVPASKFAR